MGSWILSDKDRIRRCPKHVAASKTVKRCEEAVWQDIKRNYSQAKVFINVPYEDAYKPLLATIIATLQYAGMLPVVAAQLSDGSWYRLCKICHLMQTAKYCLTDLSISRLHNIPFELGFFTAIGRIGHVLILFDKKEDEHKVRIFDAQFSNMKSAEVIYHGKDQERLARELLRRLQSLHEAKETLFNKTRGKSRERCVKQIVARANSLLRHMHPSGLEQLLMIERFVVDKHGNPPTK